MHIVHTYCMPSTRRDPDLRLYSAGPTLTRAETPVSRYSGSMAISALSRTGYVVREATTTRTEGVIGIDTRGQRDSPRLAAKPGRRSPIDRKVSHAYAFREPPVRICIYMHARCMCAEFLPMRCGGTEMFHLVGCTPHFSLLLSLSLKIIRSADTL